MTHKSSGEGQLTDAVVVAVRHQQQSFAVHTQTARKLELTGTAALRPDLSLKPTAAVEYLRICRQNKQTLYQTLYGAIVVTLAMLLRLINCRFIIIYSLLKHAALICCA